MNKCRGTSTLVSTAVALTAVLGLAGCTSAPTVDTTTPGAEAPAAPAAGGALTADNFAERISTAQFAAGSAAFSTDMDVQGQAMSMQGQMVISDNLDDVRMGMVMEVPGAGTMEMRFLGDVIYMSMGELTQGKFVEIDQEMMGAGADFGGLADQLTEQQFAYDAFADALTDFSVADQTEMLDGVETQVYTLTLDTAKLAASQGVDPADFTSAGIGETMQYQLFVGPDDLPRRIVTETPAGEMTMDFSRWGEPFTIEAPSADEIIDPSTLGM